MNCPLCGSEIANNVKYCPVCGADVEAAQRRSSGQAAGYVDQTRRMPPLEDQTAPRAGQRPSRAAVPMNSSMPQQHAPRGQQQAVRNFDTSQMGGTPKWPIVLIVLLALVIIVAIVLIVINLAKPATPSAPTQTSTAASSTVDATQGTNANAPATDGATPTELTDVPAADQPATAAGLSNADAFAQLTNYYSQLAGFNDRISAVAEDFNSSYLSSDITVRQNSLATAQALWDEISAQQSGLDQMTLADGSAYVDSLNTMKTLYNDLANRIRVLVEAWQASVDAGDNPSAASDQISSILGADNGEGGVNRYKAEYDSLYPSSAPVEVA